MRKSLSAPSVVALVFLAAAPSAKATPVLDLFECKAALYAKGGEAALVTSEQTIIAVRSPVASPVPGRPWDNGVEVTSGRVQFMVSDLAEPAISVQGTFEYFHALKTSADGIPLRAVMMLNPDFDVTFQGRTASVKGPAWTGGDPTSSGLEIPISASGNPTWSSSLKQVSDGCVLSSDQFVCDFDHPKYGSAAVGCEHKESIEP